jgi:hypothetical protein
MYGQGARDGKEGTYPSGGASDKTLQRPSLGSDKMSTSTNRISQHNICDDYADSGATSCRWAQHRLITDIGVWDLVGALPALRRRRLPQSVILSDHLSSSHSALPTLLRYPSLIGSNLQNEAPRRYRHTRESQPIKSSPRPYHWLRVWRHLCRRQPSRIHARQGTTKCIPRTRLQGHAE